MWMRTTTDTWRCVWRWPGCAVKSVWRLTMRHRWMRLSALELPFNKSGEQSASKRCEISRADGRKRASGKKARIYRVRGHRNGKRRVVLIDIARRIGYNYTNWIRNKRNIYTIFILLFELMATTFERGARRAWSLRPLWLWWFGCLVGMRRLFLFKNIVNS